MPTDGQGTKWHRKIAEYFNIAIAYSERELTFTFAKKTISDYKVCSWLPPGMDRRKVCTCLAHWSYANLA